MLVSAAPAANVKLGFGTGAVDVTRLFVSMAGKPFQTVAIPLSCFANTGPVVNPFRVETSGPFSAVFGNIALAGSQTAAIACSDLR